VADTACILHGRAAKGEIRVLRWDELDRKTVTLRLLRAYEDRARAGDLSQSDIDNLTEIRYKIPDLSMRIGQSRRPERLVGHP